MNVFICWCYQANKQLPLCCSEGLQDHQLPSHWQGWEGYWSAPVTHLLLFQVLRFMAFRIHCPASNWPPTALEDTPHPSHLLPNHFQLSSVWWGSKVQRHKNRFSISCHFRFASAIRAKSRPRSRVFSKKLRSPRGCAGHLITLKWSKLVSWCINVWTVDLVMLC